VSRPAPPASDARHREAGARAIARCDALGVPPCSDSEAGLYRAWLSPAHRAAQQSLSAWMDEAGMAVRIDAASNLVGRYEGTRPDAPVLLIGSHIDSVHDAGRYDGPLGVMLGIECVAALHAAGRRLPFAIEVIAFGDEEGSRFPASMFTSRAVAGTLASAALDGVTDAAAPPWLRRWPHGGWTRHGSARPRATRPASSPIWKPTSSRAPCWKPKTCRWASSPASPRSCASS
jgi:allantoate deiminase